MEGYVMCRPEVRDGPERKGWNPFRNEAKKGWKQGYVVLHNGTLHFYARKGDTEAKRSYALLPGCSVLGPSKTDMFYTFRIAFPMEYIKSNLSSSTSQLDEIQPQPSTLQRHISHPVMSSSMDIEDDEESAPSRSSSSNTKPSTPPPTLSTFSSTSVESAFPPTVRKRRHNRTKSLDTPFVPDRPVARDDSAFESLDIQMKKNRKERRNEKKELRIEKKNAKRVVSPEKKVTGSRSRARQAEFGLESVKQCNLWIDAVNKAISATNESEVHPKVAFETPEPSVHSTVDNSPNLGTVPDEIELDALRRKSVFDKIMQKKKVAREAAIAEADEDGSRHDDDNNDDGRDRMSYAVHHVYGNMVVHREISPEDTQSVMEIEEHARYHNRTILFTSLAGLLSGLLLSYFQLMVPIQLMFGGAFALLTLYLRVEAKEEPVSPTLMTSQVVRGSPESIFTTIMNEEIRTYWDVGSSRVTVVEKRDDHCDIVHIIMRPVWIATLCMYSKSRELVLLRYWRKESDGSYYIICQSTEHPDVPRGTPFMRANMPSSAWTIQPRRLDDTNLPQSSCVSYMVTYEPGGFAGWLNKLGGFDDAFCYPLLCNVASLADCLKARDYGSGPKPELTTLSRSPSPSPNTHLSASGSLDTGIRTVRAMTIDSSKIQVDHVGLVKGIKQRTVTTNRTFFAEPDARMFDVRGPNYLNDKVKVKASGAAFHLVAYDLYAFNSPEERMNLSSRKGSFCSQFEGTEDGKGKHFTYVVNLILPSDTNLAISLCYQPEDPNWNTSDEPWAVLFRKFIDADRGFQKKRFKLIPRIIDGSFMIRKTVPAKPALVANKGLVVPFNRAPHYFEVDVDITSDSTARVITKLCLGACKNIVVDIAFLVESQESESLPEAIIGTVRCARVDLKRCMQIPVGGSLGYNK